jgi:Flp pilus assembly protein TadG
VTQSTAVQPRVLAHDQAGQALVEWAVAMTLLLYLCLGGVDLGRAYGAYIGLTNAARVGARYAVLLPNATDAQVKAQVCSIFWSGVCLTFGAGRQAA